MTTETRRDVGAATLGATVTSAWEDTAIRICIVYDCLFPYTVGGAERWYRNLAERLAAEGYDVTILTLRQWERGVEPAVPGVHVVPVGPRMALYTRGGRRRLWPPIVFGLGVFAHLARHGKRYDIVHTASFPYFSLLAAAALRRVRRFRLVVDWHEVWSREYWREYLGPLAGRIGWHVQRRCLHVRQRAFCFSRLHEQRLRDLGLHGDLTRLEGQYAGPERPRTSQLAEPVVVFAGRHIPEKNVPALVPALARARVEIPELRGVIYGDGPDRARVLRSIAEHGLEEFVAAPGFVDSATLEAAFSSALCLALPSRREGYGLVVIEASARGVPAVVVQGADNAAIELVEDGVNGVIAASPSPSGLAEAIVRVHRGGQTLRESTSSWFASNEERLSLDSSFEVVVSAYEEASARS